jgi:hypothetical protein
MPFTHSFSLQTTPNSGFGLALTDVRHALAMPTQS